MTPHEEYSGPWLALALSARDAYRLWRLSLYRQGRHLAGLEVDPGWSDGEDARAVERLRDALMALSSAVGNELAALPARSAKPAGYIPEEWRTGA